MKIMSVINQKGGVGKSTTAQALMSGLSLRGYKVLGVDMDVQGNTTFTMRAAGKEPSVLDVLKGEAQIREAIVHTENGDLVPSSKHLAGADAQITEVGKEYRLKEALETLEQSEYDYIIIDTPPALGILTINALAASHSIVIPVQADIYSLQGVTQLAETMTPVKKYCNPDLYIEGLLLTRSSPRSIISRDVTGMADEMAAKLKTKVFDAKIREGVAVKEAQISQDSIFHYAPQAKVTADYAELVDEILKPRS